MAIRTKSNRGPEGLAHIKVSARGIRVDMQEDGAVYDVPMSPELKSVKNGTYRVALSKDRTKLYLGPIAGTYVLRFHEMGNRVNNVPTTRIQRGGTFPGKNGGTFTTNDELVFVTKFVVVSENEYNDLGCSTSIPFSFVAPSTGNLADIYDSKRNLARLENFLRVVAGIENMALFEFPYNPDPSAMLSHLEKHIQSQDLLFTGQVNDRGFLDVATLSPLPAGLSPFKSKKAKKTR